MAIDYPNIKSIFFWSELNVKEPQKAWRYLLDRVEDVLNHSLFGLEDHISMAYQSLEASEFLKRLHEASTLDRDHDCSNRLLFDDFASLAVFAERPLKSIIESPNLKLIKVEKKIPTSKVKSVGSKTMDWLAKRPGNTVREKIGSEGKVLTSITEFTANTKENQHSVYLYDALYRVLANAVLKTEVSCKDCLKKKERGCQFYECVVSLMRRKSDVRNGALAGVKPIRQAVPNNKLLDDSNYRVIRKLVKKVDQYDQTYRKRWLALKQRYCRLVFLIFVSELLALPGAQLAEKWGSLKEEDSDFRFDNDKNNDNQVFELMFQDLNNGRIIQVAASLKDGVISVERSVLRKVTCLFKRTEASRYELNVGSVFNKVEKLIDSYYTTEEKEANEE